MSGSPSGSPNGSRVDRPRLPSLGLLSAIYLLEDVKQFGPQKFRLLHEAGVRFEDVVEDPALLPIGGKRGDSFRQRLAGITAKVREEARSRAERQLAAAKGLDASILTYQDPAYPRLVLESINPVPVLYVRGRLEQLGSMQAVACVGSRQIREPYSSAQRDFAQRAAALGVTVVSGFATGADTVGHLAAVEAGGVTVCVMPSGLDRPFPPENKGLWHRFLTADRVVFVSEFLFGRGAEGLTLRKRNKLIVAFSRGVLVGQSSRTGGSMNAYRFAREEHKPVATFASDGGEDTSGNQQITDERSLADEVYSAEGEPDRFDLWLSGLCS